MFELHALFRITMRCYYCRTSKYILYIDEYIQFSTNVPHTALCLFNLPMLPLMPEIRILILFLLSHNPPPDTVPVTLYLSFLLRSPQPFPRTPLRLSLASTTATQSPLHHHAHNLQPNRQPHEHEHHRPQHGIDIQIHRHIRENISENDKHSRCDDRRSCGYDGGESCQERYQDCQECAVAGHFIASFPICSEKQPRNKRHRNAEEGQDSRRQKQSRHPMRRRPNQRECRYNADRKGNYIPPDPSRQPTHLSPIPTLAAATESAETYSSPPPTTPPTKSPPD